MLRDQVMSDDTSAPFRRPVNAASLGLDDYHSIITQPMDLGTAHSQCLLGEYETLDDLVSDVELVFSNAMKYNPEGHYVYDLAIDCQKLFFEKLDTLTHKWLTHSKHENVSATHHSWKQFGHVKMGLDNLLDLKDSASNTSSMGQTSMEKDVDEISLKAITPAVNIEKP